jgi:hypothetical protein
MGCLQSPTDESPYLAIDSEGRNTHDMASFGDTLRRERELRGIELRDIADATKISIRFLQALEQDRVDVLPGGIFPKAFVRQYARHVGLDPERMVAEFVYAYGDPAPAKPSRPPDVRLGGGPQRAVVLAGLVVIAVGFLAWRMWGGSGEGSSGPASTLQAVPPGTSFPSDRVYPPPTPPVSASATPTAGLVVELVARQSSWAEIKVDGATVLSRVLEAGETQKLEARNEVLLSLGNAGGVTYTVNGRPGSPLGRAGEVRRNIAINRQSLPSLLQSGAPIVTAPAVLASAAPSSPRPRPSVAPAPSASPAAPADTETAPAPETSPSPGRR